MRKVVNTDQCAHLWANQVQGEARNAGDSASFAGDTFYSYSTPIGRIVKGCKGPVALFTPNSYSMTTAGRHLPAMRRAASHLQSFTVPSFGIKHRNGRHVDPPGEMHAVNKAHLIAQYEKRVACYMRMQSEPYRLPDMPEDLADTWTDGPVAYASAFGLVTPERDTVADAAAIVARFERLRAKRQAPGYDDKLNKARERREELKREKAEARAAEAEKTNAQRRVDFRNGAPRYSTIGGPCMLRLNGDTFETSQGANVPRADGIAMLRFIAQELRADAIPYTVGDNARPISAGGFTLRSIARDSVTIGCHVIPMAECAAMAALVGIDWPVQS